MKKQMTPSDDTELTLATAYLKAWSYDQSHLLLETADQHADIYDMAHQSVQFTLQNVSTPISTVLKFSPTMLLTGSQHGHVQRWNLPLTASTPSIQGETLEVSQFEINSLTPFNDTQVVVTDLGKTLSIWDTQTKEKVFQHSFQDFIYAVRVINNEKLELLSTNFCQFNVLEFSRKTGATTLSHSFRPNGVLGAIPIHQANLSASGQLEIIRTDKSPKSMNSIWLNQFEDKTRPTGKKAQIVPHQHGKEDPVSMREASVATVSSGNHRACFFFPKQQRVRLIDLPKNDMPHCK